LDPKGKFECERFSFSLRFEGRDSDCVERGAHKIGALAGGIGCGAARTRKPDWLHILGPSWSKPGHWPVRVQSFLHKYAFLV